MQDTIEYTAGETPDIVQSPSRVILTGFRATGKSLVGSQLAVLLGYRFVDTDEEIVARIGCSIASFVSDKGWSAFRQQERELLSRLTGINRVVIATGGGAVEHTKEWHDLRQNSLVVWLRADARIIRERLRADPVSNSQRPPLTAGDSLKEVKSILAEREPRYREGADMAIDTRDKSPEEIARLIKQHISITDINKG